MRIGIMGAGSVGCYVGGRLAARGNEVVLVGRPRLAEELAGSGLTVEGLDGSARATVRVPSFATRPEALAGCDVVLCCVKSAQTEEAAAALAAVLARGTLVVSLQNGVRNADILRRALPSQRVLGGIVGFNVVGKGEGVFRQATTGPLVLETGRPDPRANALAAAMASAGLEVETTREIAPLQWSKLVMNLNNAVSALTGRPTKELVFGEGYRRSLAAIIEEAVTVLRATKVKTARLGPLPIRLFPFVLRLPAPLLRVVASAQLRVDAEARSSMWEDIARGRQTEVEMLNGEIVRLAERHGLAAPLNTRVVALVHAVEARGQGSPLLDAEALWRALNGR